MTLPLVDLRMIRARQSNAGGGVALHRFTEMPHLASHDMLS